MSTPASRTPLLTPKLWKLLGLAFGAGLLLFLLLWLDQRNDSDFYRPSAGAPAEDGRTLPAPLPADVAGDEDGASGLGMPAPDPNAPRAAEQPRIVEAPRPATPTSTPAASSPPRTTPVAGDNPNPVPLNRAAPRYPPEALRRNQGGVVKVEIEVGADGRVQRTDIAASSGNRYLDRAALEAARRWTFRPAVVGGQAVGAKVIVPIEFNPNN